jgi:DNA repair protein RecO (recombination protein O)
MNSFKDDRNARTYRVTGINLRSKPSGESDRLMTILTKEAGLIRVIAPSARKQKSSLSGRSSLFVVNDLLIARGKSMDKITQADSLESFPKLSLDIRKLTAGQYLAELALQQAQSDQSQEGLFYLLMEHLHRLQGAEAEMILPRLTHGVYQLLAIAGVAPQMYRCCLSGEILEPEIGNPVWRAAFSLEAGGAVTVRALAEWRSQQNGSPVQSPSQSPPRSSEGNSQNSNPGLNPGLVEDLPANELDSSQFTRVAERPVRIYSAKPIQRPIQLGAVQVSLMQQLAESDLPRLDPDWLPQGMTTDMAWRSIERLLRGCAHYHFDRPIRSAALIDQLF